MAKAIIFQKSFLITGIMCFDGCGNTIQNLLNACINECMEQGILPSDAQLTVNAEPHGLGIHQLTVSIESAQTDFKDVGDSLFAKIKKDIPYDILEEQGENESRTNSQKDWINILINLISMVTVLSLTLLFPPSIFLTIGLSTLTLCSTAFTSRDYLFTFLQNFRTKSFANMATTISLGWFLSMAHTLFHAISMPLASSFSMVFMNFIMPSILIACVNGMDEIKRRLMEQAKKAQLKGVKALFPQLSEMYRYYQLTPSELKPLTQKINFERSLTQALPQSTPLSKEEEEKCTQLLRNLANTTKFVTEKRNFLKEGMLIEINTGECFPVDCTLITGSTVIDASLLTGESYQTKKLWQAIPAGAINLGPKITVYAEKDSYNSTVNQLLFRSNRAKEPLTTNEELSGFTYFYTAIIFIGLLAAVFTPIALGVATIPLVMQNIIGILFSVCPCTIAIAHQLPELISLHHRSSKGIQLRDDRFIAPSSNEIHTLVFDKTGTLTTGNSLVEFSDIPISSALWQRIYLLEKEYGRDHPIAKAIQKYYEAHNNNQALFDEVTDWEPDPAHRGLAARVQGRSVQIGNFDYFKEKDIAVPEPEKSKIEQGFSAVWVAEENVYKGIIYIQHEIRKGVSQALAQLKKEGKKIIMLTGDSLLSAQGLNKQMNSIFDAEHIHAEQTPQNKEEFLNNLLAVNGTNPKGVWFVGDGLNDAPCCRVISEQGGVSCAMDAKDKSAFFTDITLNGSLDYLFQHHQLNGFLQQNITQNKGILIYSTLLFLTLLLSFPLVGVSVSPLISMAIMLSTTFFVLFNSYRIQFHIDSVLDKERSWAKKLLGSNLSLGLLLSASTLLIGSLLAATITTGGIALPIATFTSVVMALSSIATLSAMSLLVFFMTALATSLLSDQDTQPANEASSRRITHANAPVLTGTARENTSTEYLNKAYKATENKSASYSFWSCCTPKEDEADIQEHQNKVVIV